MNDGLTKKLFNKYPALYKNSSIGLMEYGFACGDGWYHLIDLLSQLIVLRSTDIKIIQVKEKFGALRVYTKEKPKEEHSGFISGLLYMSELLSVVICDVCGKKGTLCRGPYVCTRCSEHWLDHAEASEIELEDLPFEIGDIGEMCSYMIRIFYRHIEINHPNIKILSALKEKDKLILSLLGAENDIFINGMHTMLEAYAFIIDTKTGDVLK